MQPTFLRFFGTTSLQWHLDHFDYASWWFLFGVFLAPFKGKPAVTQGELCWGQCYSRCHRPSNHLQWVVSVWGFWKRQLGLQCSRWKECSHTGEMQQPESKINKWCPIPQTILNGSTTFLSFWRGCYLFALKCSVVWGLGAQTIGPKVYQGIKKIWQALCFGPAG